MDPQRLGETVQDQEIVAWGEIPKSAVGYLIKLLNGCSNCVFNGVTNFINEIDWSQNLLTIPVYVFWNFHSWTPKSYSQISKKSYPVQSIMFVLC